MANFILERLRRNYMGFWRWYWWLAAIFVIAVLCDIASTVQFMTREPGMGDVHPGIQEAANVFGPIVGPIVGAIGKIGGGILVAIYLRRWAWLIFSVGVILAFWAAW